MSDGSRSISNKMAATGSQGKTELKEALRMLEGYPDNVLARSVIVNIPYIGVALDMFFNGAVGRIQRERIAGFMENLADRVSKLEQEIKVVPESEELLELIYQTALHAAVARSKEKRVRFANIVINHVVSQAEIAESETAADLLRDLSDLDVRVLSKCVGRSHETLNGVYFPKSHLLRQRKTL